MKTPQPGTGPSQKVPADKGVSSETLRATMAATGGRNQRRINNLRTEVTKTVEIDAESDILVDSVHEQRKMTSHLEWNDEKERFTSLVAVGLPAAEKAVNVRALYEFLRRPRTVEPDSKRP